MCESVLTNTSFKRHTATRNRMLRTYGGEILWYYDSWAEVILPIDHVDMCSM